MNKETNIKPKLSKDMKVLTKRFGGEVEAKIEDFYPKGMVLVSRMVKEIFIVNETSVIPIQ